MKVKGRIIDRYFKLTNHNPYIRIERIEVHINSTRFDTHDLAKAAAEDFADEHNMTISWEGE